MGLGAAMVGGNPASGEREKDDFYPTPEEVTRGLLQYERFEGGVWEPACGDGVMARILTAAGYKVVASDLVPRGFGVQADFLKTKPRPVPNIITNPPFNLAVPFIEHARLFRPRKFALVLKSSFWHADGRAELYERWKPARIYKMTWRPDFLGKGRPTMECMWVVWDAAHKGEPTHHLMRHPDKTRSHSSA